jgi:hypothetical protein
VPFAALGASPGEVVRVSILVTDESGHVVEQHPSAQALMVAVPHWGHDAMNWTV